MSILGIRNETENWKTAQSFAPFITDANLRYRLAQRLLAFQGHDLNCESREVEVELFWNGVRNRLASQKGKRDTPQRRAQFARIYNQLFPFLRHSIATSVDLGNGMQPINYDVSSELGKKRLYDNLHGPEIDIVLGSPGYLFIGEAKYQGEFSSGYSFGRETNKVLVHQLIQQYVVSCILQEILREEDGRQKEEIIPFVIVDSNKAQDLEQTGQPRFMIEQGWLHPENILTWDDIDQLATKN